LLFLSPAWRAAAQQTPVTSPHLTYSAVDGGIRLVWDDSAEKEGNPLIPNSDFRGYKVFRARYTIESWHLIAAFDSIEDSVYVIQDGDTLNDGARVDLPALTHTYLDTGGTFLGVEFDRPVNGLPYFYTVVAYYRRNIETEQDNYLMDDDGFAIPVFPTKRYETGDAQSDLSQVKVVPNPYKATSLFEIRYEDKIMFTNLPPAALITIYSLDGDLVDTIVHDSGTDSEKWNLTSRNNQYVVSGLYYFVVQTQTDKKIGKFVIMR
jgi:hypothetical protein